METWVSCLYQKEQLPGNYQWRGGEDEIIARSKDDEALGDTTSRYQRESSLQKHVTPRSHDKPVASRQTVPLFLSTSCRLMEIMSKWTDLKHNGTFVFKRREKGSDYNEHRVRKYAEDTRKSRDHQRVEVTGSEGKRKTIKRKEYVQNRCSLSKPSTNGIYGDK